MKGTAFSQFETVYCWMTCQSETHVQAPSTTCCIITLSHFCSCCICCDYDPFFVWFFFSAGVGGGSGGGGVLRQVQGLVSCSSAFFVFLLFFFHIFTSLKTYFSEHRDIFKYVIQILSRIINTTGAVASYHNDKHMECFSFIRYLCHFCLLLCET